MYSYLLKAWLEDRDFPPIALFINLLGELEEKFKLRFIIFYYYFSWVNLMDRITIAEKLK